MTQAVAKASRRSRRLVGLLTREGKAFVFVTLGVGLAAVNTGNNLIYLMLGLMLSTLLLSMVLSEIALARLRVFRGTPSRLFAGRPAIIGVTLANDKRRISSYSIDVEDRAAYGPPLPRCTHLKVDPRGADGATYTFTPVKRGVLLLEGFRVSTRFPFGLVEKARWIEGAAELLVYPRLVDVRLGDLARSAEKGESPSRIAGDGSEVAGLREHRVGDGARAIHWRRTASLGRLVARETMRESVAQMTLTVDNARPATADEAWDDSFEAVLSRAASEAAVALGRGMAVQVRAQGESTPVVLPGSPPDPIWRFLARLQTLPQDAAPPVPVEDAPGRGRPRSRAAGSAS